MSDAAKPRESWQTRPEAGGRIGAYLLRKLPFILGRSLARLVTYPVALYFMLRRSPERAASRAYLARVFGRNPSVLDVYRHFLCFSQVTLDRVYLMAEAFKRFDVSASGLAQFDAAIAEGRGVLMLSAHLGSFDALRVLSLRRPDLQIRILLDMGQNAELSGLLNALNPRLAATIFDARRPGPDLVLDMQAALAENAIVSTLADRLRPGNSSVGANFLGAPAAFPASPWQFAGVLRVPVILAFGLYRGGRRYDLHFEACPFELPRERRDRTGALSEVVQHFADRLAHYARLAPYNWFNLYDYWKPSPPPDDMPGPADDRQSGPQSRH
ncbi:MAG: acyltransferase [Pseudomonadota bacterium]